MDKTTFRTSDLLGILGVSRDTLRYYEEQGIVKPYQNESNLYRQYDDYDIYTLMVADFYRKRNLSLKEVRTLQSGAGIAELGNVLDSKARQLEESIRNHQYMLRIIRETKAFCKQLDKHLNRYSIRKLPAHRVLGEFSDFNAFLEYPNILQNIDLTKRDILSSIMRSYTFDHNGFTDSKMLIVQKHKAIPAETDEAYISYPKCMYTVVEDGRHRSGNSDIKHTVFEAAINWGQERGYKPLGVAFINTRLVAYHEHQERVFLEIFIPVEEA
ncbi:MerR family transcriptional regulator [Paenibacillus tepidiphilus]|uniref:MerR family transcriptional regulator n=1 Tax=Paenibacillus tepidiphilus TaxID=2608683 RepID=UPI0013A5356D|nr:MerR family transcriptional regulator [Paenibacillus tepidiphilus]